MTFLVRATGLMQEQMQSLPQLQDTALGANPQLCPWRPPCSLGWSEGWKLLSQISKPTSYVDVGAKAAVSEAEAIYP